VLRRVLLIFGLIFPVHGEAKEFAMQGVGVYTCSQFANIYKSDSNFAEDLFFNWAQGYMSGWNAAQLDAKKPSINLVDRI
jgi:hypothetical protein